MKRATSTALFVAALLLLGAVPARAHASAPNVLSLREVSAREFVISWERVEGIHDVSAAYDLLQPVFPEQCELDFPRLRCGATGLTGRIGFDGLADLSASAIIKIQWLDGSTRVLNVTAMQPRALVTEARADAGTLRRAADFIGTGVLHIWLGLDHLLFVFGLLWLVDSWRVLLKTVTAFTIAHSVTLGAATLGWYVLPAAPAEAVIALSIAFVAVEIAREPHTQEPSFTRKNPWLVAFGFGLLHGFGFANALAELQIPKTELPLALLGFNVGVELGQLVFVAGLLACRALLGNLKREVRVGLQTAGYYSMGVLAMHWFFERVAAL